MDKYKRPEKYKGFRSIPLRNPRKVDMYRCDTITRKAFRLYQKPVEGVTEDCFDNSGYGLDYEPQKIPIKVSNPFVSVTLFRVVTKYYFVEEYVLNRLRFKSKTYNSYEEALRKYDLGEVSWIYNEPF